MARASFKASAPGSLMLLGEHAVLHGQPALVCAVNRRIHVSLAPRNDGAIRITSSLGRYSASIDRIKPAKSFRFVVAAIRRFGRKLTTGFDLRIDSEFSHKIGFGSSAAVTVATLAVLSKWLNGSGSPRKLLLDGGCSRHSRTRDYYRPVTMAAAIRIRSWCCVGFRPWKPSGNSSLI